MYLPKSVPLSIGMVQGVDQPRPKANTRKIV